MAKIKQPLSLVVKEKELSRNESNFLAEPFSIFYRLCRKKVLKVKNENSTSYNVCPIKFLYRRRQQIQILRLFFNPQESLVLEISLNESTSLILTGFAYTS